MTLDEKQEVVITLIEARREIVNYIQRIHPFDKEDEKDVPILVKIDNAFELLKPKKPQP